VAAPMAERDFTRLVKEAGMQIKKSNKEWKIVDNFDNYLMSFAVTHRKGRKREVKPIYVRKFRKIIQELNL